MRRRRRLVTGLLWAALAALAPFGGAQAALLDVGPVVPEVNPSTEPNIGHGFPLWYRDTNRVPLELCVTRTASVNGPMCLTAEPNPQAPLSFPDNLGDELFWWGADASIVIPQQGALDRDGDAILVMAIEAAYSTGDVVPGAQVSFARIRIRVDTPYAGEYIITTPFKEFRFTIADDPTAIADGINHTEDIGIAEGGIFTGALAGSIGPFLYCTNAPIAVGDELFVGDPNVACQVLGSTFPSAENPSNFFRVQGPQGTNFDLQTDQFVVMGKIHTGVIPTPVTADRVTYARDNTGMQLNGFATTEVASNATNPAAPFPENFALLGTPSALQLTGTGLPTLDLNTNSPADGKFFRLSAKFAAPNPLPDTVRLTNTADVPASFIDTPLVDEVTISQARFTHQNGVLSVRASSSDAVDNPELQVFMDGMEAPLGTLVGGQLDVAFPVTDNTVDPAQTFSIPPESVTVRSAAGGSATAPVVAFVAVAPAAVTGVTALSDVSSPVLAGASVTFIATATGGSGTYEYQFLVKDPVTGWAVTRAYNASPTWTWDTTGLDPATYFIQINARSAGSTAIREASVVKTFVVEEPAPAPPAASAVILGADLASPQISGATVTFGAAGVGGSGSYQYRFWLKDPVTGWAVVQPYGASPTWVWNTPVATGNYFVQVDVRNVGSTAVREAAKVMAYAVNPAVPPAAATGVTLASDLPSPQTAGAAVTFTAQGEGGSGDYQYRFWLRTNGVWATVQAYSADATWQWDTTGVTPGTYFVQVYVRSTGSTVSSDATRVISYVVE